MKVFKVQKKKNKKKIKVFEKKKKIEVQKSPNYVPMDLVKWSFTQSGPTTEARV